MIVSDPDCPAFAVHIADGLDEDFSPLVDLTVRTPEGHLGLHLRPQEALAVANGLLSLVASLERPTGVSGDSGPIRRVSPAVPPHPNGGPA